MFNFDEDSKISEKEIQILYQTHPYLIEKRFLNQKVIPQYPLPSGFADIIAILKDEVVVIELKVEPLENIHLLQLNGYLEDSKIEFKKFSKFRGILIGKSPKDDLNETIKVLSFEVKFLILSKDVPLKIKICEKCRLANDINNNKCVFCDNTSFL